MASGAAIASIVAAAISATATTASAVIAKQSANKQIRAQEKASNLQQMSQAQEQARQNAQNAEKVQKIDDNAVGDTSIFNEGGASGVGTGSALGSTNSLNSADDWF